MSVIYHWIIVLLILSPFIAAITSIVIWKKNKNPKLPIQQNLFKYRRGWSYIFFLYAFFSFFSQIDEFNAEIFGELLGKLLFAYLLFRNYAKNKK